MQNTSKMSKSLPILIDTTAALSKAAITTTTTSTKSSLESELSGRPKAVIPSDNDDASEEKGNSDGAERPPPPPPLPSLLKPHSKLTTTKTAAPTPSSMPTAQDDVDDNNNNNQRVHDETEAIASITRHRNNQKQHEYNNDYQITAKPLYDAHQISMHDKDDGGVVKAGKNNNDKENSVHSILTTSGDAAKLSKMSPSNGATAAVTKITHNDIETVLSLMCAFALVVTLVICMIVSVRQRIKSNTKHCDKTNLISSSASCSSTTSINDCEMDFNGSTTSIACAQMTAIHV